MFSHPRVFRATTQPRCRISRRCSESRTKNRSNLANVAARHTFRAPLFLMERSGAKVVQSVRDYLLWRQHRWWEIGGRWHPETVSYSQALNLLNEAQSAFPQARSHRAGGAA